MIRQLNLNNIRNIKRAELETDSPFIIVYGANGAGKTSLLEAIHLLMAGRSFRTRESTKLINEASTDCMVTARHGDHFLGTSRKKGEKPVYRQDGNPELISTIAATFPLQLFDNSLFDLFEGPPKARRRLLDWGLFHVKQEFYSCWKHYQIALKQRNSLLRQAPEPDQLDIWDAELVRHGEILHSERGEYAGHLADQCIKSELLSELDLHFNYVPGWNQKEHSSLQGALAASRERDLQQKRSTVGPHHSDFKIVLKSKKAGDLLSRGQKKLAGYGIKLEQLRMYNERLGKRCVLLCDDFSSELDINNQQRILKQLHTLGSQIFFTLISPSELLGYAEPELLNQTRLFHVKQGEIEAVEVEAVLKK